MQYQRIGSSNINFRLESKNFFSIFGLYLFSLGAGISGYSLYLLLEVIGRVDRNIITWNGQGLFWTLILFFLGLFILFIPVEFLNVFKPFFRLDKSRSLNQSGVGLGLAIVEDIINSHGGSIQLGKSKFDGLQVKIFLPF